MPYPEAHNYLTVHWSPTGAPAEQGQFGLRFAGSFPVAGTEVTTAAIVSTFWTNATVAIPADKVLTSIKIARILTDGKYDPVVPPLIHNYSPTVPGVGTTGPTMPLQMAMVMTLLTGALSGLAHKGRVYLPAPSRLLNGNYVWINSEATNVVNGFAAMASDLDGSALGQLTVYSKGNAAVPGGFSRPVTGCQADTRPDVQRRRAGQLASSKTIVGTIS